MVSCIFGFLALHFYRLLARTSQLHDTTTFPQFITPGELEQLLEGAGCQTRLLHGMLYLPVLNTWHWVSDCSVNYALHAVKPAAPAPVTPPDETSGAPPVQHSNTTPDPSQ